VEESLSGLENVTQVDVLPGAERRWTAKVDGALGVDLRPILFKAAVAQGWDVFELKRDALDLEGIFRKLTQNV
jgi:hypothetical protein